MSEGVTFVLSAGRTGTVFLTRTLPGHVPGLHCVHEPPGSRTLLVLGNARNLVGGQWGLGERFRRGLDARRALVPEGHRYVEVNPMLCPVTDLIADLPGEVAVVHLVREPASWVQSIRAFKASGPWRYVVDHLPFGTPFPAPRPPGWFAGDQVTRALWRWQYCNEQILALEPAVHRFTTIRYEDLFGADRDMRRRALGQLLLGIGVPAPDDLDAVLGAPRANPAPAGEPVQIDPAGVAAICGPLLDRLGYADQAVSWKSGAPNGSEQRSSSR